MFAHAKGKQQKKIRQLQFQKQCIDHILLPFGIVGCTFFFDNLSRNSCIWYITSSSSSNWFNPQTYSQIHTPTVVQGEGGGWNPSPEYLICCSISKRFYLQWNAFDLLNKMRYILRVVTLLEACDVNSSGRHLGRHLRFYQELEIRLKELCHEIQPN